MQAPALLGSVPIGLQARSHEVTGSATYGDRCKHPLFLVLRFNTCVGLWYDTTGGTNPLADDSAFCEMMRALGALAGWGKGTTPVSGAACEAGAARLPPFVVAIKSLHEAGACHHLGCPVQLPSSLSLPHASTLAATYRELCDHQLTTLRRTYCRLYCTHASAPPPLPAGAPLGGTSLGAGTSLGGSASLAPQAPCGVCGETPLAAIMSSDQPVSHTRQLHAAALLASARQMVLDGAAASDAGASAADAAADSHMAHECPEREWEAGLMLLAEALALHCTSRSSSEIVAFMRHDDAEARAAKRHSVTHDHDDAAPGCTADYYNDHAHAHHVLR